MLIGYDGHTIYRVYLHDEEKIIRVKGLRIEENADRKQIFMLLAAIQL